MKVIKGEPREHLEAKVPGCGGCAGRRERFFGAPHIVEHLFPRQPVVRAEVQTWRHAPQKVHVVGAETRAPVFITGAWSLVPGAAKGPQRPGPRPALLGAESQPFPRPGAEPSWEPRRCPDPGERGPRRARRGRGLARPPGLRGCGAQRKGLVPACGAGLSGAAESGAGSSGGGRLAGGGVKAPARGKTLSEAGRAAAGTLLRGRGSEAL